MTPKMQIVWMVLEAAKANNDPTVAWYCRKCIEANRLGWRKYEGAKYYAVVREFYEAC
jgi:hypothetical protein